MSRQIRPYIGYQVCTDGSLKPAEILVTNYLIRNYGETARDILGRHGMREIVDYRKHNDDDYDCIILVVRPDAYNKIRETLLELDVVSRKVQARDNIEEEKREEIRTKAMEEFERVFKEIDNRLGEDEG